MSSREIAKIKQDSARKGPRTATLKRRKTETWLALGDFEPAVYRNHRLSSRTKTFILDDGPESLAHMRFPNWHPTIHVDLTADVLSARMLCNELKCNRENQARLRAENRALQPTSTPPVPLAVIQPNQHCLSVQLSFAWNE